MALLVRSPHENVTQPLTATNCPAGALLWPSALLPQHVTLPLALTPHEWNPAALTAVNCPAGASLWPCSWSEMDPQQVTVPSVRTPHECQ